MKLYVLLLIFLAIMAYITAGVFLFHSLEAGYEVSRQEQILDNLQTFLDNHTCLDKAMLLMLLDSFNKDIELARFVLRHNNTANIMWDGPGAASFSVSIITTIGYGNITPKTSMGRVACILYAIVGIPLLLVFMTGAGEWLCHLSDRWLACRLTAVCCSDRRRLGIALQVVLGLLLTFVVPTMVYMYHEDWTLLEAVYFWFVTLTTIGFGDLVAGNPVLLEDSVKTSASETAFRLISLTWTLWGLAFISMIITSIMRSYIRHTDKAELKAKQRVKVLVQRMSRKLRRPSSPKGPSYPGGVGEDGEGSPFTLVAQHGHVDLADELAQDTGVTLIRLTLTDRGRPRKVKVRQTRASRSVTGRDLDPRAGGVRQNGVVRVVSAPRVKDDDVVIGVEVPDTAGGGGEAEMLQDTPGGAEAVPDTSGRQAEGFHTAGRAGTILDETGQDITTASADTRDHVETVDDACETVTICDKTGQVEFLLERTDGAEATPGGTDEIEIILGKTDQLEIVPCRINQIAPAPDRSYALKGIPAIGHRPEGAACDGPELVQIVADNAERVEQQTAAPGDPSASPGPTERTVSFYVE